MVRFLGPTAREKASKPSRAISDDVSSTQQDTDAKSVSSTPPPISDADFVRGIIPGGEFASKRPPCLVNFRILRTYRRVIAKVAKVPPQRTSEEVPSNHPSVAENQLLRSRYLQGLVSTFLAHSGPEHAPLPSRLFLTPRFWTLSEAESHMELHL
ncbi:hypothetical protein BDW62DRAFT_68728 [Aspergillus aurantiobrunneus]